MLKLIMGITSRSVHIPEINGTYQFIDNYCLYVERTITPIDSVVYQEVTGPNWIFATFNTTNAKVFARTSNGPLELMPNTILYAPAYSVPEYEIVGDEVNIKFLVIKKNLFPHLDIPPAAFHNPNNLDFISFVYQEAMKPSISPFVTYEYDREINALASRTKNYIDHNYNKSINFQDLAEKFSTSLAVLSRYFKKAYHLPPLQYLNEFKTKESLFHLLKEERSVLETSVLLGFNDQKQFYENFKKVFKSPPSVLKGRQRTPHHLED